jgi:hypothetical protein
MPRKQKRILVNVEFMNSHPSLLEGFFYLGVSLLASLTYMMMIKMFKEELTPAEPGFPVLILPLPATLYLLSSISPNVSSMIGIFIVLAILYFVSSTYIYSNYMSPKTTLNVKFMLAVLVAWVFVVIFYFMRM